MLFEAKHSLTDTDFILAWGDGMDFRLHMHRSYECFLQIKGSTEIVIDDKIYVLKEGEAVLIFPFQAHSYRKIDDGKYEKSIFAPELVPEFHKRVGGLIPKDNLFHLTSHGVADMDNHFLKKSYCYKICGEFERNAVYVPAKDKIRDDIVKLLLIFVENNYGSECTLLEAAASIGYDYAYVSKIFKRNTGVPFKKYVNIIRVAKSKMLLSTSRLSITEIAAECGFNCQRTFNREFKELVAVTPIEYRNLMRQQER